MDILEVILLIVGIVIFIGSFLLPAGRSDAGRIDTDAAKQEIHGLIEEEMKTVRAQVPIKVSEAPDCPDSGNAVLSPPFPPGRTISPILSPG